MIRALHAILLGLLAVQASHLTPQQWDGYRGIWYMNQPTGDEHRYKYSGGFATYPQWHLPIAVYAEAAQKTFFVLGGSNGNISERGDELVHLVGFFDHRTGEVSRPVRLLNKQTEDAHDNPVLSIDDAGHLWVFSAAHGTSRPAYIHRSVKAHDIDAWELVSTTNFSYPQPWYLPGRGEFLFLHTLYRDGQRSLFTSRSADAHEWSEPRLLAHIDMGDYQISWPRGDRVATVFDMHPSEGRAGKGLNYRSNIYYLETADGGRSWTNVRGERVALPVTSITNPALVLDSLAADRNVYLKDLDFDAAGWPVILYLTSRGYEPGPGSGPFTWLTAHWTGDQWEHRRFTESDHNYDHGALYVEADGTWRVIAPTDPGPQPWGTGGDMVMWTSQDAGASWSRVRTLTHGGPRNQSYARKPLHAHPEFYALWADGNPLEPSESHIYFSTRDGDVFMLPARMDTPTAKPERSGTHTGAAR
jgi:hypothetical protein